MNRKTKFRAKGREFRHEMCIRDRHDALAQCLGDAAEFAR